MFDIRQASNEILMCCCKGWKQSERERVDLSACHLLIYRPQVSEAVEELRETTPPAGQQPQGQADRQAEDDTERGG